MRALCIAIALLMPFVAHAEDSPHVGTAEEKMQWMWKQILLHEGQDPTPAKATKLGRVVRTGHNLLRLRRVFKAMEEGRDIIEHNRDKPIHQKPGRLVKMRFESTARTTGALHDGTELLARFSLGIASKGSHMPGIALKAFRDGKPSVNLLAMSSLDGQGADANPFRQSPSNALTEPKSLRGKIGARTFELFSGNDEAWLPVDHFGLVDGKKPFEVRLVPTKEAKELGGQGGSYEARLDRVKSGTAVYDVFVRFSNDEAKLQKIGTLRTNSKMVRSSFGSRIVFGHKSARGSRLARWKNRAKQVGRLVRGKAGPRLKHGPSHPTKARGR